MARNTEQTQSWGWFKGGVALGLLSAFAFLSYKPLGVSTSYPRAVALALNTVIPDWVAANAYFQRVQPIVDWQLMLVLGIFLGGWIASRFAGGAVSGGGTVALADSGGAGQGRSVIRSGASCPVDGAERQRSPKFLFWGGFLLLFGARLAGGCTSGHVITGFTQLAAASLLFAATVFAVGIPVARYIAAKEVA